MRRINLPIVFCVLAVWVLACGPKITEKQLNQSDRFYEAAYISWLEEKDTLKAIRLLTRAVEVNPDNAHAHYLLGNIRLGRAEYDLAEVHLRRAVALRGNESATGLAEAQNSLGVLLIHKKAFDEAIVLLKAASSEVLYREPWLAMGNLGWAYVEIGEYDKAIDILTKAVTEQPKFCVGRYRLGQAYYHKGDYELAKPQLVETVKKNESGCHRMQEAQHLLGMVYLRLEEDAMAKEAFGLCISINVSSELGVKCASASTSLE